MDAEHKMTIQDQVKVQIQGFNHYKGILERRVALIEHQTERRSPNPLVVDEMRMLVEALQTVCESSLPSKL